MHNQRSRKIFSIVTLKLWYQYPVIDGIFCLLYKYNSLIVYHTVYTLNTRQYSVNMFISHHSVYSLAQFRFARRYAIERAMALKFIYFPLLQFKLASVNERRFSVFMMIAMLYYTSY